MAVPVQTGAFGWWAGSRFPGLLPADVGSAGTAAPAPRWSRGLDAGPRLAPRSVRGGEAGCHRAGSH